MKIVRQLPYYLKYGFETVVLKKKKPIIGCVIVTDVCNLHCRHCSVNNINKEFYPYEQLLKEFRMLYDMGARIMMLYGGESFLWKDGDRTIRDLVIEAKKMGFFNVNIVTNGCFPLDIPEVDSFLVSFDGTKEKHNLVRGDTYDLILKNIRESRRNNIILYMAVNALNKEDVAAVGYLAKEEPNVKAVSYNLHTPYPDTKDIALSKEDKIQILSTIKRLMKEKVPVFNLKSVFPYVIENNFPRPAYQSVVVEKGQIWPCGRCLDIPGLCDECGFLYVAEYSLGFSGNLKVAFDMLKTYMKYV